MDNLLERVSGHGVCGVGEQNGYLRIFEGLHEIEEREEYSVTLKGKPGTRPGSCRAADT